MRMKTYLLLFFLLMNFVSTAQVTAWDDTKTKNWPVDFTKIDISSTVDGILQPCIIYKSTKAKQPLIVSLHSWSGDYAQADSISWEIAERNWNYIHPNFRGPNWTTEACGSALVVQDIEDAIAYAIKELDADPSEVHIVGASGGGHAAMICYLQLNYPVKSVSAWVGISNLVDWYYESVSRGQRYAKDILKATGDTLKLNFEEAKKRSPFFMRANPMTKNRQLFLYAGIHDGYNGSVPITQTLQFYNKAVKEIYPSSKNLISLKDMLELVVKRSFPSAPSNMRLGDRKIHYQRQEQKIRVTIFEGKHEQVVKAVLALMPVGNRIVSKPVNILCIGDSNGEIKEGWVTQLGFELPEADIINKCKSGNTIGFDNTGNEGLNELKNIDRHLREAASAIPGKKFDYVIIALGTNDTKIDFALRQNEIANNMQLLIDKIRSSKLPQFQKSKIIIVSPPPIAEAGNLSSNNAVKYNGSAVRMEKLLVELEAVAKMNACTFINTNILLKPNWAEFTYDGIHFKPNGARLAARAIGSFITN